MSVPLGTTTIPLSETVQPRLLSASWSYPIEAPALILLCLSTMAPLILPRGSIITSSNITDCSTTASLSTITPGESIEFHTVPSLTIQPSQTIDCGVFPPRTPLLGGNG